MKQQAADDLAETLLKTETPGEAGLRKRNVELLSDQMETFYKSGNLIDLMFLAEVMFLHVNSRDTELLSDKILRHLGFEYKEEPEPSIIQDAPSAEKIAARSLIEDVETAFEDWLRFAPATELHLLQQALALSHSGGLVAAFLGEVGVQMPEKTGAANV